MITFILNQNFDSWLLMITKLKLNLLKLAWQTMQRKVSIAICLLMADYYSSFTMTYGQRIMIESNYLIERQFNWNEIEFSIQMVFENNQKNIISSFVVTLKLLEIT